MVIGYLGSINCYCILFEVDYVFNIVYLLVCKYNFKYVLLIEENVFDGLEVCIVYESMIVGYNNYIKNYGLMIESFNKGLMYSCK